jgi:predicted RNA-binding protein (TIGR00451 family)
VFIVVELKKHNNGEILVENALNRIRSIADYQFGKGVGVKLFPENVSIVYSKATGRIRYVYLNDKRLATLRPTDGLLSLSITAAKLVAENRSFARSFVTVRRDVSKFVADGSDVFAVHVVNADESIHAKDEVIVVDEDNQVLAVGRALLSSAEMKAFKTGVAVKVRHGCVKES